MSQKKEKTIIVTGGAGFIGSNFVDRAMAKGYRVIVLDALTYAGYMGNLDAWKTNPNFRFVEGDILDYPLVLGLLKEHSAHALINFAAESHVDRSITGPDAFVQTNITGTSRLLVAAREYWQSLNATEAQAFRYVQISTDEVYGSLGATGKFSEKSNYEPNSPYSASKAGADHLVRAWHHTYGLPTITTHCSNNYGPRQYPEKLIPLMIQSALNGKPLPVYGDGKNIRDWIHVRDHCEGILLALEKGHPGGTYCFGGNAERPNIDIVAAICEILDANKPRADRKSYREQIKFVEDRLGHDRRYAIDDTLAQKELGFRRSVTLNEGLQETIEWYMANQDWCAAVQARTKQAK